MNVVIWFNDDGNISGFVHVTLYHQLGDTFSYASSRCSVSQILLKSESYRELIERTKHFCLSIEPFRSRSLSILDVKSNQSVNWVF